MRHGERGELTICQGLFDHLNFFGSAHQPVILAPQQGRLQRNELCFEKNVLDNLAFLQGTVEKFSVA